MAQPTYAQDTRELLHFRRTLVSFRSRFLPIAIGPGSMVAVYGNPLQIEVRKSLPFNGAFRPWCLSNKQLFLVHRI